MVCQWTREKVILGTPQIFVRSFTYVTSSLLSHINDELKWLKTHQILVLIPSSRCLQLATVS